MISLGALGAALGCLVASVMFTWFSRFRIPGDDQAWMRARSRDLRYFGAAVACAGVLWGVIDALEAWA